MDTTVLRTLDPLSFYDHYRSLNSRPDGRSQNQIRPISVHSRVLSSEISDGSSSVAIGSTSILANATCVALSPDYDNTQATESGSIEVTVLLPERRSGRVLFSSASSRSGSLALRLEHALNLCLKHSSLAVQYKLLAREGEKVSKSESDNHNHSSVIKDGWKILLELVCTSYNGNVTDAAFLAAASALKRASFPEKHHQTGVEVNCNGHRFLAKSLSKGPEFLYFPISLSFVRIKGGSEFVCDPSSSNVEDEAVSALVYGSALPLRAAALSTAAISVEIPIFLNEVTQKAHGTDNEVLRVLVSGNPTVTMREIEKVIDVAKNQVGKIFRPVLDILIE
jgi:exosome complex component RRP43